MPAGEGRGSMVAQQHGQVATAASLEEEAATREENRREGGALAWDC